MKLTNKKIPIISLVLALILTTSLAVYANDTAPVLILHNNTTQDLYIYTMQSTYGEEPTIAEADQRKKIKRINPNKQLTIPISTTYTDTSIVTARWKLGSQAGQGDTVAVLVAPDNEHCLIEVFIKENTYELVTPQKQPACVKKISIL